MDLLFGIILGLILYNIVLVLLVWIRLRIMEAPKELVQDLLHPLGFLITKRMISMISWLYIFSQSVTESSENQDVISSIGEKLLENPPRSFNYDKEISKILSNRDS